MADWIEISGFKSIREAHLELRPLNLLIGANGSGKSNFVQVFGLLNQMTEGRLQVSVAKAGGASSLLHHGPKLTPRLRFQFWEEPNSYEALLAFADDDTLFFERERCFFHAPGYSQPYKEDLGGGHRETKLAEQAAKSPNKVPSHVLSRLASWRVYHFHDTSPMAAVKLKGKVDDNSRLRADASNLAAFLFRLHETEEHAYRRIVAAIRLVAPFFHDFLLRPDPIKSDSIRLEWSEYGSDAYFNAHALSDGTLRFICLATLLLQPELPSMVIIDEPELGLHPYAITQLAAMLRAASERTRVLVATQSVTLINQFEPQDLVIVNREGLESKFCRVPPDDVASWIEAYALGEVWEKNLLGGRPSTP